jgi:cell division septum initiation protein DivIVA
MNGFKQAFKSLGRIFGSTLGRGLIDWLFGKQVTGAGGTIVKTPGILGSSGVEDWWKNVLGGDKKGAFGESGQVRQLMFSLGTMIAAYGMQKGNRAASSIGFAATAASVASTLWPANPYAAVIAAIIAAIAGWFAGDGKNMIRYQFRIAFNRVRVGEITGGVPQEEEQAIQRQLQERYDAIRRGFYKVGVLLLSSLNIDWSKFTLTGPDGGWYERETKNLQNAIQAFMNNTLPQAMVEYVFPAVARAILQANLGVSEEVLAQWKEAFSTGEFDKVMERFQNWVALLVSIRDTLEETGKDINTVISDIKKGSRERWQEDFTKQFTKMQNVFQAVSGSDIDTSLETYNNLLEQAKELYNNNIEYLRSLVNLQDQLNESFKDYQRELRLTELRQTDFNGLVAELSGEFTNALRGMSGARNPEELQKFAQEVLRSAQAIMQLVDAIKQWIDQLDELKKEFDNIGELMNRNIFQWTADLNKNSAQTFADSIGKAIHRITELKQGLDSLTPEQKIARFREMASSFNEAMQALDDFARSIDEATKSINESINSMLEDIKLEEFDKSGNVQGKAQYIVDQMHNLYQMLSQATSPEEVNSIVQQILRYAGMLRQMGDQIQLDIGGGRLVSVNEWLQMLLPDVSTIAQNKLNEFRTQWEGARTQLLSQLSGLADDIAGERSNLQNVLNNLTNLVKDNLNPALNTANQLLGTWIDEVARANDELNNFILSLQGAVAALAPLQPIPTQPSEGGGEEDGNENGEPQEPGRRTPLGELAYGATNAANALDVVRAASEELASRFAALGGAVNVNITLDRGLLADVWGQTDLVRLSMRE